MITEYHKPTISYKETKKNNKISGYILEDKKVLISAPIGGKKQYSINLWFEWVANQEYRNFDICICVNGKDRGELLKKLEKVEIITKYKDEKKIISLDLPNSDDLSIIQKITYARETIRRYAVKNGYDAIFWLDTDTIPANKDAIKRLLSWNVESVSGLYFYKDSKVPVAIDSDTNTNFSLKKIEDFVDINKLMPTWGTGYGCLIHQGQAMTTAFDYDTFGEERTDDFGHCHALEHKGIFRWLDPMVLCKHFSDKASRDKINKINSIIGLKGKD